LRSPRRIVKAATAFVEHDDVEVDLAPGVIPKNEIPGAGIRTGLDRDYRPVAKNPVPRSTRKIAIGISA
jgi:hypothetical protein